VLNPRGAGDRCPARSLARCGAAGSAAPAPSATSVTPRRYRRIMTGSETADPGREPVGRVLGTEDATPLAFWVPVAPEQYLQLDDVVVCERRVPGRDESVHLSGIVTQVRARHEGARFDSDVFLIEDGQLPAEPVEAAEVLTTRVEPEVFVPPTPGTAVHRAGVQ